MPRTFLDEIVRPNIEEFAAEYDSLRRASNAVSSVDALAAHLYRWCLTNNPAEVDGVKNDSDYRGKLAGRNYNFRLLRDIAKAQKHVHLGQGKPEITAASQINSQTLGYGQAKYGGGRYGGVRQIIVYLDNGSIEYVESIVNSSVEFLEAEMVRLGVPHRETEMSQTVV